MTGDAVDHGLGGRETRRDLVVAGLTQYDPGDRRPLAVDPADGLEGEAAAGRGVQRGRRGRVFFRTSGVSRDCPRTGTVPENGSRLSVRLQGQSPAGTVPH